MNVHTYFVCIRRCRQSIVVCWAICVCAVFVVDVALLDHLMILLHSDGGARRKMNEEARGVPCAAGMVCTFC